MAVSSDQHGIFRINVGDARDDHVSQFGRALATLGIESICATSPQAKGRVERANATLQDRLVKAMRLAGIASIDAANAWLPDFVARHNARFAVTPADARDAHAPHPAEHDGELRRILSKHYPRTLSNQLSCQFHSTLLQAHTASSGSSLRGAKVTVLEHFDQAHELRWKTFPYPSQPSPKCAARRPSRPARKFWPSRVPYGRPQTTRGEQRRSER